jgi:bleomycin hydrolase
VLLLLATASQAQYIFKDAIRLDATSVKDQQNTGSCWSFATASFLESELVRMGKERINLSEMYVVRQVYLEKAYNYLMRQGKANFSQGGLSHDLLRVAMRQGVVPEEIFTGRKVNQAYNHAALEEEMLALLNKMLKERSNISGTWKEKVEKLLNEHLGVVPDTFMLQGKQYTPKSYAQSLALPLEDYVTIASFSHHPFYKSFVLEIPDNYSNGSYYNVPLDEFEQAIDHALKQGYTLSWDGDVSERTFASDKGLAVFPADPKQVEFALQQPVMQAPVNQAFRQRAFEDLETADDHLMHLIGMAFDQHGEKYYILKNSWGEIGAQRGYIYMTASYFRMKTIAVTLHKNALPKATADKLWK